MCACQEMAPAVKVNTRLMTSRNSTLPRSDRDWKSRPRLRNACTASAPNTPKMAPEAPTTAELSGAATSTSTDPANPDMKYRMRNLPRPSAASMNPPTTHSAHMLKRMWKMPLCRNIEVNMRQYWLSRSTAGTYSEPHW